MAVKIRLVRVTPGDEDEDEDGGFVRFAITPSFPNWMYIFLKSSFERIDPAIF